MKTEVLSFMLKHQF